MASTVNDIRVRQALVDLEGSRAFGQRPEVAGLHPFPARMPAAVAEHLVQKLTTKNAVVVDPMVGSGTTLVAALRHGRHATGFDRDPLARLLARTATSVVDADRLTRVEQRVLETARRAVRRERTYLPEVRLQMSDEDRAFLDYWFPMESQRQLCALLQAVEQETSGTEKDFALLVFSSLIIAKSAGASMALDLPRSRPHKRTDKPVVLPFDAWTRRFRTAVERLPFRGKTPTAIARVVSGDARSLPLDADTVDFVLTSPPYLNAIDYLRAHKFSLVWMGHSLTDLRELRGTMLGTERGLWTVDGLPPRLESRLVDTLGEDRDRALRRRYLSDLNKVIAEIGRILRPKGLAILVLGPTIISSRRTDAASIVAALGETAGLRLVATVARQLRSRHRSLPPPPIVGHKNPLAFRMRREVIVALRKT